MRYNSPAVFHYPSMSDTAVRQRGGDSIPSTGSGQSGRECFMTRTERELIEDCQRGSEDAFRELVERYQRRAFWIAYHMLGDAEISRDVCQEAFLRVFRAIARFHAGRSFYAWLYQIVLNLSIDQLRKVRGRRQPTLEAVAEPTDPDPGPVGHLQREELRRRVQRVLTRLPIKYRTVIALRDIQNLSVEEIAEIVGSNRATVRWRLHRARKIFQEIWERTEKHAVS